SVVGGERVGRYSFLGSGPSSWRTRRSGPSTSCSWTWAATTSAGWPATARRSSPSGQRARGGVRGDARQGEGLAAGARDYGEAMMTGRETADGKLRRPFGRKKAMTRSTKLLSVPPGQVYYPDSEEDPMGETDFHAFAMIMLREGLEDFFAPRRQVYVAANLFL